MADIQQIASDVLDKGDRFLRVDDYEARMDYFAQELEKLDPSARAALFDEVLEQDSGAPMSWLTTERLDTLVSEGRITSQERSAVVDAFGQAYVDGDIDLVEALQFTNIFGSGAIGPMGMMSPASDQLEALMQTLTESNSSYSSEFIEKFASDVLTQRVLAEPTMFSPAEQGAYVGVLLNALSQSGRSTAVHNVVSQLSPEQQSAVRSAAGGEGLTFGNPAYDGAGVRDPMAILTEAVSRHGTSAEVLDLVKYAGAHSSGNVLENQFLDHDNKPYDQRAEALGELFETHSATILRDLTVANPTQTSGSSNDRATVVGDNLAALSNLVRLTGLNPDNSHSAAVMSALGDFSSENIRVGNMAENTDANGDGRIDDADIQAIDTGNGRTAMIGAVLQDAVSSGYVDLRADQAAREAFLGFVIDVAVSAIPVGGKFAGKAITEQVSAALGGLNEQARSAITDALAAIPTKLLTDAQGQLTAEAKKAIIDALPTDYQYLEGIKEQSNGFIENTILGSTVRDYQITESISDYRGYIDNSKGR
ncbi:hypothetical protein [Lysobacter sp. A03]|uniref:hypothetical protein n=1 Tax=Lysobacter sp. A03 TaxID=1199154 RepID=UPI0005B7327D|nr:hypothetical protein [Lysobacter sp. A03]KIQ97024.1 hypothetical protein TI01_1480 [Lysobacter sp. A03]